MSLPHALLIALIEKPGSGLELSAHFDDSIGRYWHTTHQQIYRELARLEAAGWVEATPVESARGGKKEYRVLEAGREELRRWIAEPRDIEPYRNELMVRMRGEAALGPSGLAPEIERRLQMHQARLAIYRGLEKSEFMGRDLPRPEALSYLILKKGIMNEVTWIDWLKEVLRVLDEDRPQVPPKATKR